jgi:hypothetical protein
MELSLLNFRTAAVRPVPPAPPAAPARSGSQPAPAPDADRRPPPVEPPSPTVGVEVTRRRDGVQRLTFVDLRTGVVISQTPPEQVLHVVDSIVEAIQRRERENADR